MAVTNFSYAKIINRLRTARENDSEGDAAAVAQPEVAMPAVAGATPAEGDPVIPATGLSQEKVNALLAAERRKAKAASDKLAEQLKQIQQSANLTAAEREGLAQNLEELRIASMTKEQLAAQKLNEAKAEAANRVKAIEAERDKYKNNFEQYLITRSISDNAAPVAWNPSQFIPVLAPHARVVEVMGEGNVPTGQHEVKVRLTQVKDGKPQTLDLTVAEAIGQLEKDPSWANLFKSNQVAGAGVNPAKPTGNVATTLRGISSADYRKIRDQVIRGN